MSATKHRDETVGALAALVRHLGDGDPVGLLAEVAERIGGARVDRDPESSLVDVGPPTSPAGRVAAELGELLAGHVTTWRAVKLSGGLITGVAGFQASERVDHLRAIRSLAPDATVEAHLEREGWLFIFLDLVRDGVPARVSTTAGTDACWSDLRAGLLAWLTEIGVDPAVTR